jgi:pilus assembly protein CpaF
MSIAEQEDDARGHLQRRSGLRPARAVAGRDDIADIMVNGAEQCFIEVDGKMQDAGIRFRDNAQLLNICQRIVSQVGRRVDEASPICDARLLDGSRVNVIAPPLAIDGAALTIRKFKKDKPQAGRPGRFRLDHQGWR